MSWWYSATRNRFGETSGGEHAQVEWQPHIVSKLLPGGSEFLARLSHVTCSCGADGRRRGLPLMIASLTTHNCQLPTPKLVLRGAVGCRLGGFYPTTSMPIERAVPATVL